MACFDHGVLPNVLAAGSKIDQTKEGRELDPGQEARGHPSGSWGDGGGNKCQRSRYHRMDSVLGTLHIHSGENGEGKVIVLIYR